MNDNYELLLLWRCLGECVRGGIMVDTLVGIGHRQRRRRRRGRRRRKRGSSFFSSPTIFLREGRWRRRGKHSWLPLVKGLLLHVCGHTLLSSCLSNSKTGSLSIFLAFVVVSTFNLVLFF